MDIEDYFDIVRRHKAWILGPTFAALVVSTVVACVWPDTYVSTGIIRVVPPQVPESYVPTNINSQMSQRINSMYQTISSRGESDEHDHSVRLIPPRPQPQADGRRRRADAPRHRDQQGWLPLSQGEREISAFQISFSY